MCARRFLVYAVLETIAFGATARAQTALDLLLDRAPALTSGTYSVNERTVEASNETIPLAVHADVAKGPERTIRVPIVIAARVPRDAVALLRVVSVDGDPTRIAARASGNGPAGRLHVASELTLAPGEYEIHAVVGTTAAGGGVLAALDKSRIVVPDVWSDALAVGPVALGEAVAATPSREGPSPLTYGTTALTPAPTRDFRREGVLHAAFHVYNGPASTDEGADLTVEYAFFEQKGSRLVFFNKTRPQRISRNARPDASDTDHGVAGGISLPLSAFPPGEFEMRLRVRDDRSKRRAERQVRFRVVR
jgi:hypothetical protein